MAQTRNRQPTHGLLDTILWIGMGMCCILLLLGVFRRWPRVELIMQLAVGLAVFINLLGAIWRRWPGLPAAFLSGRIAFILTLGLFWRDVLPVAGRGLVVAGFLLAGLTIWRTSGERQVSAAPAASEPLVSRTYQRWTMYLITFSLVTQALERLLLANAMAVAAPSATFGLLSVLCYWGLRTYKAWPICFCVAVSITLCLVCGWWLLLSYWRTHFVIYPGAVLLMGIDVLIIAGVGWRIEHYSQAEAPLESAGRVQ